MEKGDVIHAKIVECTCIEFEWIHVLQKIYFEDEKAVEINPTLYPLFHYRVCSLKSISENKSNCHTYYGNLSPGSVVEYVRVREQTFRGSVLMRQNVRIN